MACIDKHGPEKVFKHRGLYGFMEENPDEWMQYIQYKPTMYEFMNLPESLWGNKKLAKVFYDIGKYRTAAKFKDVLREDEDFFFDVLKHEKGVITVIKTDDKRLDNDEFVLKVVALSEDILRLLSSEDKRFQDKEFLLKAFEANPKVCRYLLPKYSEKHSPILKDEIINNPEKFNKALSVGQTAFEYIDKSKRNDPDFMARCFSINSAVAELVIETEREPVDGLFSTMTNNLTREELNMDVDKALIQIDPAVLKFFEDRCKQKMARHTRRLSYKNRENLRKYALKVAIEQNKYDYYAENVHNVPQAQSDESMKQAIENPGAWVSKNTP